MMRPAVILYLAVLFSDSCLNSFNQVNGEYNSTLVTLVNKSKAGNNSTTQNKLEHARDILVTAKKAKGTQNTYANSDQNLLLKLDKDYTPFEIADYIFNTGDEKGITQLITEMIQDGQTMPSGDDLINFLEQVQLELNNLRSSSL